MLSHPHPVESNIEACWACGGERTRHTTSEPKTQANPKKQRNPQPVLWHPINRHTHIKRENNFAVSWTPRQQLTKKKAKGISFLTGTLRFSDIVFFWTARNGRDPIPPKPND
jgi:hypothetical protein